MQMILAQTPPCRLCALLSIPRVEKKRYSYNPIPPQTDDASAHAERAYAMSPPTPHRFLCQPHLAGYAWIFTAFSTSKLLSFITQTPPSHLGRGSLCLPKQGWGMGRTSQSLCQPPAQINFCLSREFNLLNCRLLHAVISDFLLRNPNRFAHAFVFCVKQRMLK